MEVEDYKDEIVDEHECPVDPVRIVGLAEPSHILIVHKFSAHQPSRDVEQD